MPAVLGDLLLLIGETVAEAQQEAQERASRGTGGTTTLPGGMVEQRVNYRELEGE